MKNFRCRKRQEEAKTVINMSGREWGIAANKVLFIFKKRFSTKTYIMDTP